MHYVTSNVHRKLDFLLKKNKKLLFNKLGINSLKNPSLALPKDVVLDKLLERETHAYHVMIIQNL